MNSSEGLNDRYSGKPWTDMLGGEEFYHLSNFCHIDDKSILIRFNR